MTSNGRDEHARSALGRLAAVPLREAWTNEEREFTPWLAREENLVVLGAALGIDLELEATEKNVGPFRADILCQDIANNDLVLIENQLEATDHKHLGQLLTYAAGLETVKVIWVAAKFTEEHRAALNWLNEVTTERAQFFGLEVELWRIGDSPPAPKFNVISKPNEWSRQASKAARATSELTETKELQRRYWTEFAQYIEEHDCAVRPTKPLPQHWMNLAIGRSKFKLIIKQSTRDGWLKVGLVMLGDDAKAHYHLLRREKDEIERELGETIEWAELPDNIESHIKFENHDADPANEDEWQDQFEWLREKLNKLYEVFHPRVAYLDAAEWEPHEEDAPEASTPST